MRTSAGIRRYRPNLRSNSDVIAVSRPQRFLDSLYCRFNLHLAQPGTLQPFSSQALFHSVDLYFPKPFHHHIHAQRKAESLDNVLEVEQRDVADHTACRQQIDALNGLEREKPFFEVLEDIHG